MAIAAGDALVVEPRWLSITERDVPVDGLPTSLEGLKIAQLSDLHLSAIGSIEEDVVAAIRSLGVHLVAFTGDAVESASNLSSLEALVSAALAAGASEVVGTMGNWEHWGHIPFADVANAYARAGGTLLGNESRMLKSGIAAVATDDYCVGRADLGAAMKRVNRSAPATVLLTHAPGVLDQPPKDAPRFDLALAGHTHGGQVRPGFTLWTPPGSGRFVAGAYDTPCGPAYVSRGIGTSVLAVRFGCRPELPIFRMTRG